MECKPQVSKLQIGVNDQEYEKWCQISDNYRLIDVLVRQNPRLAVKFFYVFQDNCYGNKLTWERNRDTSLEIGKALVESEHAPRFPARLTLDITRCLEIIPHREYAPAPYKEVRNTKPKKYKYDPEKTAENILRLVKQRWKRRTQFEREAGLSEYYLTRMREGKLRPQLTRLDRICRAGNFNLDYIVFSEGSKLVPLSYRAESLEFCVGFDKSKMGRRMSEVLRKSGKNQKMLCDFFEADTTAVNFIINGKETPVMTHLAKIGQFLDTSLNYLVYGIYPSGYCWHREMDDRPVEPGSFNIEIFKERVDEIMRIRGINKKDIAQKVGVPRLSISQTLNQDTKIRLTSLDRICKGASTTPNYLILGNGGEDKNPPGDEIDAKRHSRDTFLEKLLRHIRDQGLTYAQAAKKAGMSVNTFRSMVQEIHHPTLPVFANLCINLEIEPNYLFWE